MFALSDKVPISLLISDTYFSIVVLIRHVYHIWVSTSPIWRS